MNMQIVNDKGYTKHYFEENKRVCSNIGGGFRYAGYDIMEPIELITPFLEQWHRRAGFAIPHYVIIRISCYGKR